MSLFSKFRHSLARTRAAMVSAFVSPQWSAEEMERGLLAADFGPRLASEIVARVQKRLELNPRAARAEAIAAARSEIESLLKDGAPPSSFTPTLATPRHEIGVHPHARNPALRDRSSPLPSVLLLVGVNGSGKTTTTAKLAERFKREGGKVLLAAADTFRAAAIEQLTAWGARLGVDVVATSYKADPASVAHDAIQRARAEGYTQLLVDTAGRQHTKANLMQELQKIRRVIAKALPGAPHETWLVVDAPTGGNALSQAREFHAAIHLTGIIVTKLDGSSKGGMVVAIHQETGLPIRFVGLGEGVDDLEPFDPKIFAEAILDA